MILNRQRRAAVSLAGLERFWQRVRRMMGLPADCVTICLVPDAQIARWNRAYRRKQGPTDVLSFPVNERPSDNPRTLGRGRRALQRPRVPQSYPGRTNRVTKALTLAAKHTPKRPTAGKALAVAAIGRGNGHGGSRYLGDIAIAPAVARRNARRLGRSLEHELRILILHGTLHLAGYNHETDRGEMDRLERRLRRRLGLE